MDWAVGLRQRLAATTPARLDDLSGNRDSRLFRSSGAKIQTDR